MKLNSLHDLCLTALKDLYNAEQQIIGALPKMAKAASSPERERTFEDHLAQTRVQAQRLEQILEKLGEPAKGQTCKGMEGIIEEGEDLMGEDGPLAVGDAALGASAPHGEHYEIAAYGTACTLARRVGFEDHAQLLEQTLDEEVKIDKKLTSLADSYINEEAKSAR